METWYFETSALNFFAQGRNVQDAIATKAFQNVRGRKWVISPVTLWEIMLTGDDKKKEHLIYLSQNLFDRELLPSPEELLVGYIKKGFPLREQPYDLVSQSNIANTWRHLVDNPEKTFVYDKQELRRRINLLKPLNKMLHQIVSGKDILLIVEDLKSGTHATLESVLNRLQFLKGETPTVDQRNIYKISIFYLMFILCAEVGLENIFIQQFWEEIGIEGTKERILFSLSHFEPLIYRGPLATFATMIYCQAQSKFARGGYFDSLHAFYLTYVDKYFTNDVHFKNFRKSLFPHPNASKIHHMSEIKITEHARDNNIPKGIIAT
jgi:hypothetical protein